MSEIKAKWTNKDNLGTETTASDYIKGEQSQIIAKAKAALIESTNIETSPKEMAVLNDFLFRCWQMGWLDKYKEQEHDS